MALPQRSHGQGNDPQRRGQVLESSLPSKRDGTFEDVTEKPAAGMGYGMGVAVGLRHDGFEIYM